MLDLRLSWTNYDFPSFLILYSMLPSQMFEALFPQSHSDVSALKTRLLTYSSMLFLYFCYGNRALWSRIPWRVVLRLKRKLVSFLTFLFLQILVLVIVSSACGGVTWPKCVHSAKNKTGH